MQQMVAQQDCTGLGVMTMQMMLMPAQCHMLQRRSRHLPPTDINEAYEEYATEGE